MRKAWIVLLLLLAGCVTGPRPSSYDYPFPGKVDKDWRSPALMVETCGRPAKGCSYAYDRGLPTAYCKMFLNSAYRKSASWTRKIIQHENRHCNGYRGELDY